MADHPVSSGPTDNELVAASRKGGTEAFRALVERYQDRIYNTVYRLAGNEEDARDIAQETFLRVYENLARFRGDAAFYTWVFRIAVNQALTHRRQMARQRTVQAGDEPLEAPLAGSQAARLAPAGPEEEMQRQETEAQIAEALAYLDADHRAAVVLRDVEGLDYQAIAAVLDVPPGTVKSRIHRARLLLRQRLRDVLVQ
jgi:RNA polymerase sigma-70 factor (ECF subfamily)